MSQTKRGNTYTRITTLRGIDLTTATEVVVTVKPHGRAAWNFDRDHISLTSDGTDTTIAYRLSQEQSLSLPEGVVYVDINWTIGGTRSGVPNFDSFRVTPTLYTALMDGTSDEPDPSYVDPDISVLPAEDVRVIGAVSPRVSFERGEDCTVLTIHDIDGTHVVEIPDGQQGDPGANGIGITSIAKTSTSGLTDTYTITLSNGNTSTFTVTNGADGDPGDTGQDGVSPVISVTDITGGHRVSITDKNGTQTVDVLDGTNGTPGTDGTDAYVYIRYSVNEPTADSDMKTTPDAWIGIYSGDAASAPTHYTDYVWYKIKGETGAAGVVQDVQVNGTSVVTSGVANVPIATLNNLGVVGVNQSYGLSILNDGTLLINNATAAEIKQSYQNYKPIVASTQPSAAFYGLARAAGDTTQSASSNAVGNYTDNAKDKIQQMLGIIDMIAPHEGAQASRVYSIGKAFVYAGKLYKATAAIASGDAIVPNTNCTQITLTEMIGG